MVIVTGGAGFIGSAVIWKLNEQGIDDILVVDNLSTSEKWKNLVNRRYRDYIHKSELLTQLQSGRLDPIEAIIHMGACSSTTERDADFLVENNYHYSKKLAKYAISKGIRFINASSAATYGDGELGFSDHPGQLDTYKPMNMYGYSKHLFDLWAHRSSQMDKLVSLKFFNVFGPNEYHKGDMSSVVFKSFHEVRETGKINLFKSYKKAFPDGGQKRDFVYVKDCAELILWLIENPSINGIFNVGTGEARTWNELAGAIFNALNHKKEIQYTDMPNQLKDRYQYYTCADMKRLKSTGCPVDFLSIESAVTDYIRQYLLKPDIYL